MRNSFGQFVKGNTPWHKGKKGLLLNSGRTHFKKGVTPWNKGKTGLSYSSKGKKRPSITGNKHPLWGKHPSSETIQKLRDSHKGQLPKTHYVKGDPRITGKNNHFWNGGSSYEPYPVSWTKTLRRAIRERDKYICFICHNEGLIVHHIDYDKKNCNPSNLITLCNPCHGKTNHDRTNWSKWFTKQTNTSI